MAIAGLRGTGDWGADERPQNFRELILWQNPNGKAPIFALSSKAKKEATTDPQFHWWEEIQGIIRVQVNGAIGGTTGDINFTLHNSTAANAGVDANGRRGAGLDLVVGDLLLVESANGVEAAFDNEIVGVFSVSSDTSIVCLREIAGTTAAVIPDGAYLTKIGNSYSEGSTSPEATSRNPQKFTNYAQIWKTAYERTKTAEATKARTGDVKKNDQKRRSFDHSAAIEMSLLFGKSAEIVGGNGKPQRYTGGLLEFLQAASRTKVYAGAVTSNQFFDDIYDVFDYDSESGAGDERIVYCGNVALNTINKLAAASGEVQHKEVVRLYGMNLTKWVLPQGTFYFRTHPLMNQHPNFQASMFITDPGGIRWRPLRDTMPQDNIQAPDEDTCKGQWLTEGGFEFNYMENMRYLGNVSTI